jgi:subtilisin family serine protease
MFLTPRTHPHKPRKARVSRGERRVFTRRSPTEWAALRRQADRVVEASQEKARVYADPRLYFVIEFSDSLSWPAIRDTLQGLEGSVVRMLSETKVKVAILRDEYPRFLESLYEGRHYILEIGEPQVRNVVDPGLIQMVESDASMLVEATIELVDESGLRDSIGLQSALSGFLERENLGHVTESYVSERIALYDGNIRASAVPEIARSIGTVDRIQQTPEVALVSEFGRYTMENTQLSSAISLADKTSVRAVLPSQLPCVCAIDSGVNKGHAQLQQFVAGTFDLATNAQLPCDDIDGHGSMVSGLIVRGGDLTRNINPLSTVAMVKGFINRSAPMMDTISMIGRAIGIFGDRTRVYNLSFASSGLDPSRSRVLDEIVYSKEIMVVACAGNIRQPKILQHLHGGEKYPDYLLQNPIYYPGDSDNVVTVGSYASKPSNWIHEDYPSPFTRTGVSIERIKPDVVEDGGNLDQQGSSPITGLSGKDRGVTSTWLGANNFAEECGTSFSTPTVASLASRILQHYGEAGPFLAKAMIISSSEQLRDISGARFPPLIQGYGIPNHDHALNAYRWKASYLLQGTFMGNKEEYHGCTFKFPSDADRLTITFVAGKPPGSRGSFSIALKKAGVKPTTIPQPSSYIGSRQTRKRIVTTWQETHRVTKGGKGNWWLGVYPHFDKLTRGDRSLKYGCMITIESSKGLDVYTEMARWVAASQRVLPRQAEAPMVTLQAQAQEASISRRTRRRK